MAKCVILFAANMGDAAVKRVSDDEAAKLVKDGWKYCDKTTWKSLGRPR